MDATPARPNERLPEPEETRRGDPSDLLLDAFLLLDRLGRLRFRLLRSGEPSRRLLAALERPGDGPEPAFVFSLAEEAGLVRVRGGFLRRSETSEAFLRAGPVEQLRQLTAAWADSRRWDDLEHLAAGPARRGRPRERRDPRAIRKSLLAALSSRCDGRWHAIEGLFSEDGEEHAPRDLGLLLSGPLRHLGLVEVSPASEPATHARLTPLGSHLLAGAPPPEVPPAPRPLRVQPTFEVIQEGAGLAVDLGLSLDLSLLGTPERGDRTLVFRLERDEVTTAFHRGWSAERILRRLSETSAMPVAQNLVFTLHQWEERSRRLTLYPEATLLEIDPRLLERLCRRRSLAEAILAEPAPGLVLLKASRVQRVLRHLRSREVLVTRVDHSRSPGGRLRVDGEGRVRAGGDELDGEAARWLSRAARRARAGERGDWRILASRVRRAAGQGLGADRLLRLLEARAGPLPPELQIRLLAWGGEAGALTLKNGVLHAGRPALLGLLLRSPSLDGLLERSGACRADIRDGAGRRLSARLRALGLIPEGEAKTKK
jgi:hypothetical protein